jgi:hypothetical protein
MNKHHFFFWSVNMETPALQLISVLKDILNDKNISLSMKEKISNIMPCVFLVYYEDVFSYIFTSWFL